MTKYDFVVLRTDKRDSDWLVGEMDPLGDLGFAVVGVLPDGRVLMQRAREYDKRMGGYA